MPSGRTHDRITLYTLPVAAGLSLLTTRDSSLTLIVCGGFLFSGLMMGPDLDVRSLHYRRWGWFRWIWIPYRGSLHHRSLVSHSPLVGTAVRVVYLLMWVALLGLVQLTLANEIAQLGWTWGDIAYILGRSLRQYRHQWLALIVGLELGALSHYIADWGTTLVKRARKQGWQKTLQFPFGPPPSRRRSPRASSSSRPASGTRSPPRRRPRS